MDVPSTSRGSSGEVDDITKPRMYADVNINKPNIFKTPDTRDFVWTNLEFYDRCSALGEGACCNVFVAKRRHSLMNKEYALKVAKPTYEFYILKELKVLQHMGKNHRITKVVHPMAGFTRSTVIVGVLLEMQARETMEQTQKSFSDFENQRYLNHILEALNFCHSKGIMHRDLKPENILVDRRKRRAYLIDWGSAEFYLPGKHYYTHVGSR